jgi:peroxiredoxin Q/BCP
MNIKKGDKCPDFELQNQFGEKVAISEFIGKQNLVIYFYPKDDTPGCTKQACSFRDSFQDFIDHGAMVIGISSDSIAKHKSFASRYNLQFPLLADENKIVRKLFGVPTNLLGIIPGRVTYIVDKKGIVQGVFNSQLNVEQHVAEALKILDKL